MIAFVLSGGGNRGALQVGALQALAERGVRPDIVVGTSAGAINGLMVAYDPSPGHLSKLADIWRNLSRESIYPGNYATMLWRLARGDAGLFPNDSFKSFLAGHTPNNVQTFAELTTAAGVKFYATATQIPSGQLHVFGDDESENLLDALVASSALPPFHPPYRIGDRVYVDGGVVSNLPLQVALDRGAKTVYALHIADDPAEQAPGYGAMSVAYWSIAKLLHEQVTAELEGVNRQRGVKVYYIQLTSDFPLTATDFSQGKQLINRGYGLAMEYLNHQPLPLATQIGQHLKDWAHHLSSLPGQAKAAVQRATSADAQQNAG
ncbi:MAG: patatin-like phospholipase family protein [Anaerolineae bacterium]